MMRTVGNTMQSLGYEVEYLHCSSDNDSLDGIRLPELEIALIDGTAPHVVDPRHPGAVDEILHLGDFWDEKALRTEREQILAINREVGATFRRAYRYLAAAKCVYDDIEAIHQAAFNPGLANVIYDSLVQDYLAALPVSAAPGRVRHLFASAITPSGPENYLRNLMDPLPHKCIVTGSPGTGRSTLIQKFVAAAAACGQYVEAFHCALDPLKYEHAIVPSLGLAIVTSADPHFYSAAGGRIIDMHTCLDPLSVRMRSTALLESQQVYQNLFTRAVQSLAEAKRWHDQLETHYVPHMNFTAIDAYRERIIQRILGYAAETNKNGVQLNERLVSS